MANGAELLYQSADLPGALGAYQKLLEEAENMKRPQGVAPNWPAYARFRLAQVQALQGDLDAARAGLEALAADLDPHSNLLPLVATMSAGLESSEPDAALRAMASLHSLRLYESYVRLDDHPADLTFPMNMTTLLWPGTPLALDLQQQRAEYPGRERIEIAPEPLRQRWSRPRVPRGRWST